MKMTTGILGCALVAGLMTFAADKAQAGVVIGNDLYSPLKLKGTAQYESGGKIKKMSFTSKDVLKELGDTAKDHRLAVQSDIGDVWIITKDSLVRDLSTNDVPVLALYTSSVVRSEKDNKEKEIGILEVAFNSDMSLTSFDIFGVYNYAQNTGKTTKGTYSYSEKLKANGLVGSGTFPGLGESIPTTGSASYSGSGKLTPVL